MKRWLVLLALLGAGCHEAETTGGVLTVTLETPRTGDGALLVLIAGGPVTVARSAAHQVVTTTDAAGTHLLLLGDLAAGEVARLEIPDIGRAGAYVALVEQVADRSSFVLLDPVDYRVRLQPVP